MYGLYRAWFGSGTAASYPCLQDTFSPPDTVVRVGNEGEHQFVAHKGVLAAHSGYLKALLASAAQTTTMTTTSSSVATANSLYDPANIAVTTTNEQSPRPVTSVSVSSIGKYMSFDKSKAPIFTCFSDSLYTILLYNKIFRLRVPTFCYHYPLILKIYDKKGL